MLATGQRLHLVIEKPAAGGRMIARVDGQVVLVSGAVPGERVLAEVDRVGKGAAFARTLSVDEPSPDRRPPFTDPECGGCTYAYIDYPRQLRLKGEVVADAMGRIGRIAVPPPAVAASTPVDGYRMRARLHFKDGRAGFFREATHDVCDARETRQLRPETSDVLERIAARLVSLERSPVRDIEVSENVSGAERAVYLDASEPLDPAAFVGLADSEGITGLAVRGTGREASLVSGTAYVTDVLSAHGESVTLRRHVQSFFQANRHLLGRFLDHVVSLVPPGASVVDLYAGVGLFAVALAGRASSVVAVEGDRLSAQDLAHNAGMAIGSVEVVRLPVEAFLERVPTTPDILIVDPPRTGMSRDAIRGAVALRAPTVVYVSCDVATLARDTRTLVDAGYALGDLQAFDMFPNTPHVETVAVFSRRA